MGSFWLNETCTANSMPKTTLGGVGSLNVLLVPSRKRCSPKSRKGPNLWIWLAPSQTSTSVMLQPAIVASLAAMDAAL